MLKGSEMCTLHFDQVAARHDGDGHFPWHSDHDGAGARSLRRGLMDDVTPVPAPHTTEYHGT